MGKFWDLYQLTRRCKNYTFRLCTLICEDLIHLGYSKLLFCKAMTSQRSSEDINDTSCCFEKNSDSETTPVRFPKGAKTEVIFDRLGVSFLKKMKNLNFPAIKTDCCAKECSDYYQLKALIMRNLKNTHTVVI